MAERTGKLSLYLTKLKKSSLKGLDEAVAAIHGEVFGGIDCLSCAECCRSLGPRISRTDITRIAELLRITESAFETAYLRIDEDGDFVFTTMPCPFLASDNYCLIYPERPKACREYPHTEKNFKKAIPQTILNLKTCPAVVNIVKTLMERYPV